MGLTLNDLLLSLMDFNEIKLNHYLIFKYSYNAFAVFLSNPNRVYKALLKYW